MNEQRANPGWLPAVSGTGDGIVYRPPSVLPFQVRSEALARAIEFHRANAAKDDEVVSTAFLFESFLTGDPSIEATDV